MGDDFKEQRFITVTKHKKEEGKLKRFIITPLKNLAEWEIKDPKKNRLTA